MLVIGLVLFALLIIVHEFGHMWMARRQGVEVEEFGLGLPPRLIGKKFKGSKTLYSLNLIPLGGFVKLKGETASDRRPRSFGRAPFSGKAKILLAGVAMNILVAFALLTVLGWVGLPQIVPNQFSISGDEHQLKRAVTVAGIVDGSPASQLGIKSDDELLAIDGQPLRSSQQLLDYLKTKPQPKVALTWRREREIFNRSFELKKNTQGILQLGVYPYDEVINRYSWSAPLVALGVVAQLSWLTLLGIGQLAANLFAGRGGEALEGVVGPVGLFMLLSNTGELGLIYLLVLIVVISVSLGVVNALPIPALDGGRLAVIGLFRALKKPLSSKIESAIHGFGFVALIILALVLSYFDAVRFF